jgi:hypothetical protein
MPAIALRPDHSPVTEPVRTTKMAEKKPEDAPLLFCPFCRECFEQSEALVAPGGGVQCPEHELALVPFDQLPRSLEEIESELPADDENVTLFDPRFGRGFAFAGAGMLIASFWMTFVVIASDGRERAISGFAAASDRAPNLWTVPFVAVMIIAILVRRRSLAKMRGARLSILLLALAPLFALGYSYFQVARGAAAQSAIAGAAQMTVSPGSAGLVAAMAAVSIAIGAHRLGIVRIPGMGPVSADPERSSPIVADEPVKKRGRRAR